MLDFFNTLIVGSRSLSDLYSYSSTYNDCKYIHTKSECFSYKLDTSCMSFSKKFKFKTKSAKPLNMMLSVLERERIKSLAVDAIVVNTLNASRNTISSVLLLNLVHSGRELCFDERTISIYGGNGFLLSSSSSSSTSILKVIEELKCKLYHGVKSSPLFKFITTFKAFSTSGCLLIDHNLSIGPLYPPESAILPANEIGPCSEPTRSSRDETNLDNPSVMRQICITFFCASAIFVVELFSILVGKYQTSDSKYRSITSLTKFRYLLSDKTIFIKSVISLRYIALDSNKSIKYRPIKLLSPYNPINLQMHSILCNAEVSLKCISCFQGTFLDTSAKLSSNNSKRDFLFCPSNILCNLSTDSLASFSTSGCSSSDKTINVSIKLSNSPVLMLSCFIHMCGH
ncbi:hypothetical protein AGLY_009430 [Aphis glycines]|uniref:Uncharacterized protein n=1 Tax=Aphis glycines TaxID=307491 RepID=A0A6G0THK8_APHGL|nr:hypothetical protein AGLY_009430 [Aphis glycines]